MKPGRGEIDEFVAGISYKPGWSFRVAWPPPGDRMLGSQALLVANAYLPDVHNPDKSTLITTTKPLPEYMIRDRGDWRKMLAFEIHELIASLEGHERLEWLRFDGEWIWHPHPGGESRNSPHGEPFEAVRAG